MLIPYHSPASEALPIDYETKYFRCSWTLRGRLTLAVKWRRGKASKCKQKHSTGVHSTASLALSFMIQSLFNATNALAD